MLNAESRLVVNASEVAGQVIDGEAIIMHLTSGMFYSADKAGALIWDAIERGHSLGAIAQGLTGRYEISREQAQEDVERFATTLVDNGLAQAGVPDGTARDSAIAPADPRVAYQPPELHGYSDMVDLLALDPPMPVLGATPWAGPKQDA
jgi:hypothetical protein